MARGGHNRRHPSIGGAGCVVVCVNTVVRALRREGRSRIGWRFPERGYLMATTTLGADGSGETRLTFDLEDIGGRRAACAAQRVQLVALPQPHPLAGVRWFFVCPINGARCVKLFLPSGTDRFGGRTGYRLVHTSRAAAKASRAEIALRSAYRRLGGDWPGDPPDKPKRMRWATYNRIMAQAEAAQDAMDARLMWVLERIAGPQSGAEVSRQSRVAGRSLADGG